MTNTEKDLGVMISDDLKPSNQCSKAIKTANKLVRFIGRTFEHKSEKVNLTLYNSLVRLLLEYCVQFWFLYHRRDIGDLIEAFRMFKGFVNVHVNDYFTLTQSRVTRGNDYKVFISRSKTLLL